MPYDFDALQTTATLGDLKAAGYRSRSVKDELRANLLEAIRRGDPLFPGLLGYEDTVLPQVQQALLARHDLLLLGLRGQAKTRLVRSLPRFLDPLLPVIEGSEVHEDPFAPFTKYGRERLADEGDDLRIAWIGRDARYGEKLATPDTTIADLIGDIDPIKAAARRLSYADEEVLHFGLIPRTNRGIFCINELPDLQPRIQVGLFNILEEQDVQIRGFHLRFPLDVLMVFTANPEDYTNRGAIITPLKDRIDAQITTHYPKTLDIGVEITRQEAWQERDGAATVEIPHYLREVVEQTAFEARESEYVDQKSGVSARMTRAALELVVSAAELRTALAGETATTLRPTDLLAMEPALSGKMELVYEGEQTGAGAVARLLVGKAVKKTFLRYFPDPSDRKGQGDRASGRAAYQPVLDWFAKGNRITLTPTLRDADYRKALDAVPGLSDVARRLGPESDAAHAAAMEFVLEGLHQHSLLGKEAGEASASYGDLMGAMLSGLTSRPSKGRSAFEDDDFGFDDEDDTPPRRRR
ncbi:MAG: magnesium chelatase [Rhodothermales bacterium]|nr:magnesium chelatase [Rhodothermales bacterium]